MRRSGTTLLLTATLLLAGCSRVSVTPGAQRPSAEPAIPWSYEGESGPAHWADEYPVCAGKAQSPIDVKATAIADLPPLEFEYVTIGGTIVDTGRALQVDTEGGALTVGDSTYTLLQIRFHVPSEHTIEGRRFDAVMHLIHAGDGGRLAVVGVPFEVGEENEFIGEVLAAAAEPVDAGLPTEIDIEDAVPAHTEYYTYEGSLTTPPCTEGVRWFVLRNPETLSAEQLEELAGYYRNNVRPVQRLNERSIFHRPG